MGRLTHGLCLAVLTNTLIPSLQIPMWSLCSPHSHRELLDTEPLQRKGLPAAGASGLAWEHDTGERGAGPAPGGTATWEEPLCLCISY